MVVQLVADSGGLYSARLAESLNGKLGGVILGSYFPFIEFSYFYEDYDVI